MKTKRIIKDSLLSLLVISLTAGAYAAISSVSSWDPLTATMWNDIATDVNNNTNTLSWVTNNSGNIGIGTTNPTSTLHVDSPNGAVVRVSRLATNPSNYAQLEYDGTDATLRSQGAIKVTTGGGAERMRIDSAGRVLVWTTSQIASSAERFSVYSSSNGHTRLANSDDNYAPLYVTNSSASTATKQPYITLNDWSGNRWGIWVTNSTSKVWLSGWGWIDFLVWGSSPASNNAISIENNGQLRVSYNSDRVTPKTYAIYTWSSNDTPTHSYTWIRSNTVGNEAEDWAFRANTTYWKYNRFTFRWVETWSITWWTTSVSYNTTSDYRLKENVTPINNATERVNALKPVRFNFKSDTSATVDWFIAHEVQEVVPEAVTWEKDWEKYQQMDYAKVTPLLTAGLQEALKQIEELKKVNKKLEKRISVLESK